MSSTIWLKEVGYRASAAAGSADVLGVLATFLELYPEESSFFLFLTDGLWPETWMEKSLTG